MRNFVELNDLYNTEDAILLTEIIENRFQATQNTYGFNPRKCNSASSMKETYRKLFLPYQQKMNTVKFLRKL